MSKGKGKSRSGVEGKIQIGPYLTPELVERLRKSAEENKRGLSDEVSVALDFYLTYGTESAAKKLLEALEKAGLPTA